MSEYRVTGPFPFRGNAPDSTFEADCDEQIERAVKRGSISPVTAAPQAPSAPAHAPSTETPEPSSTPSPQTNTSPKSSAPHVGHAGGHKKKE